MKKRIEKEKVEKVEKAVRKSRKKDEREKNLKKIDLKGEETNGVVVEESRGVVIYFVQNWGRKGKVDIFIL